MEKEKELDCELRYTLAEDEPFLCKWLQNPSVVHWFSFGVAEAEMVAKNWVAYAKYSSSLTLLHEGVPCGIGTIFLMPNIRLCHHATLMLVVDPNWQHKGFGSTLLRNLVHLAKNYFHLEMLGIEIMRGSPLISLLQKNRFKMIYSQEQFFLVDGEYIAREYWEVQL